MGNAFSSEDYRSKLSTFSDTYLTLEHSNDIDQFLKLSDDFVNVFTSITLDDFRNIRIHKADNIIHLVSHVSANFKVNK